MSGGAKKRKAVKNNKTDIGKELEQHYLERDDYWDEKDNYHIDDEDHAELLGDEKPAKLAFGFYVDDHIADVYPCLGLPLDECMAILTVRYERDDDWCLYKEKERAARKPWLPLPNEYGVVPWIGVWKRQMLSDFPRLADSEWRGRPSNRELRRARKGGLCAMYQKLGPAMLEDKARYMREMEEAKKKLEK